MLDNNEIVNYTILVSEESKEKITTDVYFRGIAGRLEGKYTQNKDNTSPSVLLLPPDPRYGGTLDNAVIVAIEKVFRDCGFTTLRINYRGIHRSDGVFGGPEDAIYDAATALDWLQEQNPESSHFWLVGYSFGAWVDANIMMRRPEIETFVLVSPIVDKYDFSFISPCLCSGLVISGENDEIAKLDSISKMVDEMNETNLTHTTLVSVSGANHLYSNRIQELSQEIEKYINITLATRVAKPVRKKRRRRKKKDSVLFF